MGLFKRKTQEIRADTGTVSYEDSLLQALLGGSEMDKKKALAIPSVKASIGIIANTISSLPIKLYEKGEDGKIVEITDDKRLKILNDDTGDTLTSTQYWRSMLEDYLLGKGAYAYINKEKGQFKSLHYVDETYVTIQKNTDPIFKDYDIYVNGLPYKPYEFFKILRNTKDGASSTSLLQENALIFAVAYYSLNFENTLVQKGGNKKGFLKSAKNLADDAMTKLKESWKNLFSNNSENMMILNNGLEFQETSSTSVEMQLNEQKITNSCEISMLLNVPNSIIRGNASEQDDKNYIKKCIIPILNDIECSLDRDLLLEKEKGNRYFAIDTKELTRGSIKERYEAYEIGIRSNFLQIDQVREAEDMEALGLNWIKLGLDSVLYNPKTGQIYTANTNKMQIMGNNGTIDENTESKPIADNVQGDAQIELDGTVSSISLNGAQIQSLLQIVTAVAGNQLQYDSAITLITSAFPFDEETAKKILGNPKLLDVVAVNTDNIEKSGDVKDGN